MCTDRQAVKNSLEDWVISDKESLVAWVRRFLWHYEGVCSGNGTEEAPYKPEVTIVENIIRVLHCGDGLQIEPIPMPDPESYFQS